MALFHSLVPPSVISYGLTKGISFSITESHYLSTYTFPLLHSYTAIATTVFLLDLDLETMQMHFYAPIFSNIYHLE